MKYYPKSQIKENQYTNGGEYKISSTQEGYTGFFWETSDGNFFTGKTPNDKPTQELIKSSNPRASENQPVFLQPEADEDDYFVIDSSYYQSKGLSRKRIPPRSPIQTLNKPSDKDIQNGFFNRYFVKKGNESRFIEISKLEYNKFKNHDNSVQWQLYIPTKIKWDIEGPREQVYNGNRTVVSLTEQRENLPGFSLSFRGKFDKFWIGK